MPVLNQPKQEKVFLPSTKDKTGDNAWVEMITGPMVGADIVGVDPRGDEITAVMAMLKNRIINWNFTDISGQPVPVTVENIKRLAWEDIQFLQDLIQQYVSGLSDEEKKS